MPKDRFHAYLDYCDSNGPIGVGDYIEMVAPKEKLGWTMLMRDCLDTFRAGKLKRIVTKNGSAAYVRPHTLSPTDEKSNDGKEPQNGNVR